MRTEHLPGGHRLHIGDSLPWLQGLEDGSAKAVITDPPYIIGATSVGNSGSKSGTWADMENAAHWFAAWLRESRRVTGPDGHIFSCTNWRSLPTMIRAADMAGFTWNGCAVWDKQWIGPGGNQSFRPRYELVLHAAGASASIEDRSTPDVVAIKWHGTMRASDHAAEKPVALYSWAIELATAPGDVIIDPFGGSGTALAAADMAGRTCWISEREPAYADDIRSRVGIRPPPPTNRSLASLPLFRNQE